jgi:hypothetical protein
MKHIILGLFFCLLTATLLFISCREEIVSREPAIMRIGSASLTERELIEALGEDATPEEKLNFIREWSNTELTYQAAIELGLHKDENTRRIIRDMERNLLSVLYIQQAVSDAKPIELLSSEIQQEFRDSAHLYVRHEPVVRAARIAVDNLRLAWQIRDGLSVENFRARSNVHSLEATPLFEEIAFVPQSAFAPVIWNTVFNTRINGLTAPLEENGRFYIYLILARENAGTQAPLEEAIDLIKRNILARKQNEIVGEIFTGLRNRSDYSFDREFMANLGTPGTRANNVPETEVQAVDE